MFKVEVLISHPQPVAASYIHQIWHWGEGQWYETMPLILTNIHTCTTIQAVHRAAWLQMVAQ